MNRLFAFFMIFSCLAGVIFQRTSNMTEAILSLPEAVFNLCLSLVANACLWSGFLAIAKKSGLIVRLSHLLKPLFSWMYPDLKDEAALLGLLTSNFIANFLGLSGLALMSGLDAMKQLDQLNHQQPHLSRSMRTLIICNTTGCSLFPMTIIATRRAFQAQDAIGFAGYTLLIGVVVLVIGLLIQKGLEKHG